MSARLRTPRTDAIARLRYDNQTGTLGLPLAQGATSATLAQPWTAATVVAPDFVAIELEPPTAGVRSANYEVVYATPVQGSTALTITARGQEGTANVAHATATVWSHGATAQDFVDSDVQFGTPAIALGTVAAIGSSGFAVQSDATIIAFDTTAPVTQNFGDVAATGSAAVAARRDHAHGMPASPAVPLHGVGAPSSGLGVDGNYYFRDDGGIGTHIYFKTGGAWGAII